MSASMLLLSCGPSETPTSTSTATATATITATTTATTTATATGTATTTATPTSNLGDLAKPPGGIDGGRLQLVAAGTILNIGDIIDQVAGPGDAAYAFPVVEPLLRLDGDGNFQPWLAERFEIAADFSSITLWLRHGVKFTDGTDFNAAAVKYVIDVARANPVYTNAWSLESPVIINDYQVRIDFKDGQWNWDGAKGLATWWGEMMFSPKSLQDHANDPDWLKINCIGTGPFILTEFQRDQKLVYQRNPNYWRGVPYLEGIDYQIIPDATTQLLAYKAGEVDMIGVQLKDVDRLKSEGFSIIQSEDMLFNYALIPSSNNPDSPLADVRIRQAIQYAINQQAIIDGITYGYGKPAQQEFCIAPYMDPNTVGYPYNVQAAKDLLTLAGHPDGIDITLTFNEFIPMDVPLALQDMFADAGIHLTFNKVSIIQFGAIIMSTGWEGLLYSYAFPGKTIDPGFTAGLYLGQPGTWISTAKPPEIQALIAEGAVEPDNTKRIAIFQEVSKMMTEQCLHQYVYYQGGFSSITPFLKGYTIGQYKEFFAYTFAYFDRS